MGTTWPAALSSVHASCTRLPADLPALPNHEPSQLASICSCAPMVRAWPLLFLCLQGEPWPAAFVGHEVDPLTQQEEQRRLMLERFQQEVLSLHAWLGRLHAQISTHEEGPCSPQRICFVHVCLREARLRPSTTIVACHQQTRCMSSDGSSV